MENYDVIVVGAGPSGIFCSYKLITENPNLKILMIEKGNSIEKRICPKRKLGKCVNCNPCNITTGFSGAGAFSDGKLTLASSETGGNLSELIGEDEVKKLIKEMDDIYLSFGADTKLHGVDNREAIDKIRTKAIQANMKLVESPIRHLGTEASYDIYSKLQNYLIEHGVEIKFNTMVEDIIIDDNVICGVKTKENEYYAPKVVVGAGREGSAWFKVICDKHKIKTVPGTVDLGVRVECRDEVMKELNEAMYESKLIYHTKTYADKVRTFCQNPSGEVALENYNLPDGSHITTVNGHAYKGDEYKTNNTNFALLVSKNFTEPFKEPLEYGAAYARIANMLAGGTVLVQTYGDIKRGRRSTEARIRYGNVVPTLKDAVPGDLMSCIPARIMTDIIEMIEAMDKIVPGIANDETLLYGIEVKFYSNKVLIDKNCETNIKGLYAIGDSSSWTRGLSLASGMGLYVASKILN
jgi:uncharacterized FAD-dependent dehydrogenase